MSGNKSFFTANPFLLFALGDRLTRAVTGVPGVITDGEYDLANLGAAALDAGAVALIAAVEQAVQKAHKAGMLRDGGMYRDIELTSRGGAASVFRVLDAGVAALGVIDLANGAGAPDEGGDFLAAANLIDGMGSGLAAAGPDAGRWDGSAAQGYSGRTRLMMSDVDTLRELDKQMQALMARQADAVQKAHLTVAGGMNTLVLCYPIAMWLFMTHTYTHSVAFQIGAVSAVLSGVSTMEYLTVDESAEVGRQVDAIAAQYRALCPSPPGTTGGATVDPAPSASGGAAGVEPGSPAPSEVPTVTQLAGRTGAGRAERLQSLLRLLAQDTSSRGDAAVETGPGTPLSSFAASLPAHQAPPAGVDASGPRAAQPGAARDRVSTAAAPTEEPQAADEATPAGWDGSDGSDATAAPGVPGAGTAPLRQPQAGGELATAPRRT